MLNLPPTAEALKQHILRSTYQSGHKWGNLSKNITLPSIYDWGWTVIDDKHVPFWSSLPEVSRALSESIACQCKKTALKKLVGATKMDLSPHQCVNTAMENVMCLCKTFFSQKLSISFINNNNIDVYKRQIMM